LDTKHSIIHYEIPHEGSASIKWTEKDHRVYDLALSNDSSKLAVVVNLQHDILIYNVSTREVGAKISLHTFDITSIQISNDSSTLLCSISPDRIHEYDIETKELLGVYEGHKQKAFMIRSIYGGATQTMVASGSEDSKVYLWRRRNGDEEPLAVLSGHSRGCANSIAWNPRIPDMFASAGDDATVRM
jgi:WD40 repeat protein